MYKEIKERLTELADKELQKKLWLNLNNDTGNISSYEELYCSLFDDIQIEYFIKNELSKTNNVILINEFELLIKMLNEYIEPEEYLKYKNEKYILNDPNWNKVINQSKLVLNLWDKDFFNRSSF